eukprot:scaffold1799_cov191-Amphora_coffeaeformis.AAC.7
MVSVEKPSREKGNQTTRADDDHHHHHDDDDDNDNNNKNRGRMTERASFIIGITVQGRTYLQGIKSINSSTVT